MGKSIKLNLGCGRKKIEGYIGVDLPDNAYGIAPDIAADVRSLPFGDGTVDEIMAIHLWEHFYLKDAPKIITEWKRALKPGGKLVLELPCLDKILYWFQRTSDARLTLFPLYGDPATHKSEADLHKWAWSKDSLIAFLEKHGFVNVVEKEAQYHVPQRDMRIVGYKLA